MKLYFFILGFFIISPVFAKSDTPANSVNVYLDKILETSNTHGFSSPDTSLFYANRAFNISLNNKLYLYVAKSLRSIARIEILKGSVKDAIEKLNWAIAIFKNEGDLKNVAKCYSLKAVAMSKIGNKTEEIELGYKAYYIYSSINDQAGVSSTLVNIANTYTSMNEFEKGIKVLNLCKAKTPANSKNFFFIYLNYGCIYSKTKKFQLAKENFDSSIALSNRYNMLDSKITAYTEMGNMYQEMGNNHQSILLYNQAIELSKQNKLPIEELEALKGLMISYKEVNEYKGALEAQLQINHLSDSLSTLEKIFTINSVETKSKLGEKEKIIFEQELKLIENTLQRERSRNRFIYLFIGLIVLLGFTILVIISYYRSKKSRDIILKQKAKIELQNNMVEKKNAELENLNAVNQKIFTIIAHDFKEPLISMRLLIETLKKESDHNQSLQFYTSDIRNQLIQSELILQNLLDWAKQELKLNPALVTTAVCVSDVIDEIILQLKNQSDTKKITIQNQVNKQITISTYVDILRIIYRNLIGNAIKYSQLNSTIVCGFTPHTHELYIKDTGIGISKEKLEQILHKIVQSTLGTQHEKGYGLGLYITHEMIQKSNGTIRIESEEQKGTCIYFTLPTLTSTSLA